VWALVEGRHFLVVVWLERQHLLIQLLVQVCLLDMVVMKRVAISLLRLERGNI
jgi:hypothetical protein